MNSIMKPMAVLGVAGALAIASMTPSDARVRPWVAAGIGLAAAATIGAAAANANYYGHYGYGPGYYGPVDAYAYSPGYSYAPAYSYGPAYTYGPAYNYTPPAPSDTWRYSPGYHGYDTNYVGPLRERVLQGNDY